MEESACDIVLNSENNVIAQGPLKLWCIFGLHFDDKSTTCQRERADITTNHGGITILASSHPEIPKGCILYLLRLLAYISDII